MYVWMQVQGHWPGAPSALYIAGTASLQCSRDSCSSRSDVVNSEISDLECSDYLVLHGGYDSMP